MRWLDSDIVLKKDVRTWPRIAQPMLGRANVVSIRIQAIRDVSFPRWRHVRCRIVNVAESGRRRHNRIRRETGRWPGGTAGIVVIGAAFRESSPT
ncbi:hypothetical protein M3A49_10985 [Paraburkholderia sp. CNPSo 3076]|uniref:hypothetical protein n=1 Tax=Paraburkholderia sp. CNPSo 3076 TaxID=2940936 RepID=UPI00225AA133|nr:hypothetical protein [Paraburkholderia sp. CNPSo 3076]MCX5540012.1 hypothetical protein [Paraburkholderia sp. CNPSo 3076]